MAKMANRRISSGLNRTATRGKSLDDFFNAYRGSDGTGFTVRGAYEPASTYQKTDTAMDAVQYKGSLWGYINAEAGSGNAPPESAATVSNDYWTLLVAKGDPGADGKGNRFNRENRLQRQS